MAVAGQIAGPSDKMWLADWPSVAAEGAVDDVVAVAVAAADQMPEYSMEYR